MSQHGTALDYVLLTPQEMAKADRLTIEGVFQVSNSWSGPARLWHVLRRGWFRLQVG